MKEKDTLLTGLRGSSRQADLVDFIYTKEDNHIIILKNRFACEKGLVSEETLQNCLASNSNSKQLKDKVLI